VRDVVFETSIAQFMEGIFLGVWTVCYTGVGRLHDANFAKFF